MHDNIGLQLGTSLQSAKLQLANLLQNCYLSHSENYIKLNFVVVRHKIFLARLFCAPLPAAPGGNCPPLPPSVTPLESCVRWGPHVLRNVAVATNFWLSNGYDFGCMIASDTLFDSNPGWFLGSSYLMKT